MVKLTKDQIQVLLQVLQRTQISGADAEVIAELKAVLGKALVPKPEK